MDTAYRSLSHALRFRSSLIGLMALLSCLILLATSSRCSFAGPATHFQVAFPDGDTAFDSWVSNAGDSVPVGVTALDVDNNVDTTYAGTVHLTCTDARATMPTDFTLAAGTASFDISLLTAGNQTFTATDTANPSITGTSGGAEVVPGTLVSASISGVPSVLQVGQFFTFTLDVFDAYGNNADNNSPPLNMSIFCSDPSASVPDFIDFPGDYTVQFNTPGSQGIGLDALIFGFSTGFNVEVLGPATSFEILQGNFSNVGQPTSFEVQALDDGIDETPLYNGTVHVTSIDPNAVLPGDVTFVNGHATINITYMTPGNQDMTITDTDNPSLTGNVGVSVGDPTVGYSVFISPQPVQHHPFIVNVFAKKFLGKIASDYNGTATVTSSDTHATFPSTVTFTAGIASFDVTFNTPGAQSITFTDIADHSVTGTGTANVYQAAHAYVMTASAPITAGVYFNVHVTALDSANKPIPNYTGTAHFTSTDPKAVLPPDTTFVNGTANVRVIFKTSARQTLMAVDAADTTVTASRLVVTVAANAPAHFKITTPATATAAVAFNAVITAIDVFGNTSSSYTGTVHFTSTDAQAVLPPNVTLTNGIRQFAIKLKTAGNQKLSVVDTANASIAGSSPTITVSAAAAAHLTITAPATATNGTAFYGTVKTVDLFGNTATGYSGTVHFTSPDSKAVLPADSTLTNGSKQFLFKLKTNGSQTITATDTAAPSLKVTTTPIGVS